MEEFARRLTAALDGGDIRDKQTLHQIKQRLVGELGLVTVPSDADLRTILPPDVVARHDGLLRKKPMRTQSGVAIVAVMTSPAWCPHGKCVYCPGGPDVGVPQSYTGHEPSTMRAIAHQYDPYRIVRTRLGRLQANGHAIDKVDIVLQGGTFPARESAYQDWVTAMVYRACNDGPALEDPGPLETEDAWQAMDAAARQARVLAEERANESAACRVVGLTVETKPDWCHESHIDQMLLQGATRIELGVQTLDDATLHLTHRGHDLEATRNAFALARDAGYKICAHLMPGQPRPGTRQPDRDMDLDDARRLFEEPDWRPDMLKVYPTLVVGDTGLAKWWRNGEYTPYDTDHAADVVAEILRVVPAWCRIQRVDRDIPTTQVDAGVQNSNLRQIAEGVAADRGIDVRELRAREAGVRARSGAMADVARAELRTTRYEASGGHEAFIELVDDGPDAVIGYVRMRIVAAPHRSELAPGDAIVRELKVPGAALALHAHGEAGPTWQHQGHGARLLEAAEAEARQQGAPRIFVLAGPGVKPYYRRHGYQDSGPYLCKALV